MRTPATAYRTACVDQPSEATDLMPAMTGMTVPRASTELSQSNRAERAPRDSGRRNGALTRSRSMTGRLMRNTEPHQKCSSSTPLMIGPTVTPAVRATDQIATALVRSASSWKRLRISARVDGIRVAPAIPSTARAAMSISADLRVRREEGRRAERDGADEQQPTPADPVADRAHREEQPGEDEPVDVEDPQLLRRRWAAGPGR